MSMSIEFPPELQSRLEQVAARRGKAPEELATENVEHLARFVTARHWRDIT